MRETFCGLSQPHPIQAYNGTTIAVAVLGVLLILMLSAVLAIQIYDEYLDFLDKTLERTAKPWSTLLGAFLEAKRRVLNQVFIVRRGRRDNTTSRIGTIWLQQYLP